MRGLLGQMARRIVGERRWFEIRAAGGRRLNSPAYWDHRFKQDWEDQGGRLQTALFAMGFVLCPARESITPSSLCDFGCGLGDSLPVLALGFPGARLYYYDHSSAAMAAVALRYGSLGSPLDSGSVCDLVYSSNVIEHVEDPAAVLAQMDDRASRWLAIQAPYNERHSDGSELSLSRPLGEHVRTVTLDAVLSMLPGHWVEYRFRVPWAWSGEQVLFLLDKVPVR